MRKSFVKKLVSVFLSALVVLSLFTGAFTTVSAAEKPTRGFDWANYDISNIVPGKIGVRLNKAYFGELRELFPEIGIKSYKDNILGVINASGCDPKESKLSDKIRCHYTVYLSECTVDAVVEAVDLLNNSEYVDIAEPIGYAVIAEPIEEDVVFINPTKDRSITFALAILREAAGLCGETTSTVLSEFDLDRDGEITVSDALVALRAAAGLSA